MNSIHQFWQRCRRFLFGGVRVLSVSIRHSALRDAISQYSTDTDEEFLQMTFDEMRAEIKFADGVPIHAEKINVTALHEVYRLTNGSVCLIYELHRKRYFSVFGLHEDRRVVIVSLERRWRDWFAASEDD